MLRNKISLERASVAVATANRSRFACAPWSELSDRVWELRHNLTPYDAAFVALAERRCCRPAATDRKRENRAARDCPVEVITA